MADLMETGGQQVLLADAGWPQAGIEAALALMARLGLDPAPEQASTLLELAMWRRGCRRLLQALDEADEAQLAEAISAIPEAALLAILAGNAEQLGLLLSRACTDDAGEARLAKLVQDICEGRLALGIGRSFDEDLAALRAASDAEALAEAATDPTFLLKFLLLPSGFSDAGMTPDAMMLANANNFIDASRYAASAVLLEESGDAEGAATFRLAELVARGAGAALTGEQPQLEQTAAAVLEAVHRAEAGLLTRPGWLSRFAAQQKPSLLEMLASGTADPDRRRAHAQAALDCLPAVYANLRKTEQPIGNAIAQEARLIWMLAQTHAGAELATAQATAIGRLHALMTVAIQESLLVPRFTAVTGIALALGNALYETGRFESAADHATLALAAVKQARDIYDAAVAAGAPVGADVAQFARSLLDSMAAQAARIDLIARARLAEAAGNSKDAARLYAEAAEAEARMKERVGEVLDAMFGADPRRGRLLDQVSEAAARSAQFAGMALMSEADAALLDERHAEAIALHAQARARLQEAAKMWDEAASRLPAGPAALAAGMQGRIGALRVRYCDCKVELAEAEALTVARRHSGAAARFINARNLLEVLVETSRGIDEPRNVHLAEALRHYASARMRFAIDLDAGAADNLARADDEMERAAAAFSAAGEARWADTARAQAAQFTRGVQQAAAANLPPETAAAVKAAGLAPEPGANPLPTLASAALPNPQATIGAAAVFQLSQAAATPDPRRRLLVERQALQSTIAELRDMRDRSRVQAPDFIAMFNDYSAKLADVERQIETETG